MQHMQQVTVLVLSTEEKKGDRMTRMVKEAAPSGVELPLHVLHVGFASPG
jgi:hypothetical protein